MFQSKHRIGFFSLALLALVVTAGCQESKQTSSVIPFSDDGVEPNRPTWRADTPYIVQKVGDRFFQVTLDWNPVTTNKFDQPKRNIVGYYVFRAREGGAEKKVATTTDDNYVDKSPELVESERYIYTVYAFDNLLRQSGASAPQTVRLEPTAGNIPKPPNNLFFSPNNQASLSTGKGEIIVSWDPPTQNTDGSPLDDLREFELERKAGSANTWVPIAKIPAGTNLFIDSNLNLGTYFYRVRALDKDFNPSQFIDGSFTLVGRTDLIAPGTPRNLQASGDAKVVLTWQLPLTDSNFLSLDIAGIKIYRKRLDVAEPYILVKVIPPDTTWTDVTVNLDTFYQYAVTAFDLSGNESPKSRPATNRVGVTFPDTPAGFSATILFGQVILSWQAVPGAVSYVVYRSEFSDGVYTVIGQPTTNTFTNAVNQNVTYYYKISSVDALGREGSQTTFVVALARLTSRTFEAETHIREIGRNFNASNTPFRVEVDVLQYPFENNAFMLFSPVDPTQGEAITGIPAPNIDVTAVGDFFQFTEFLAPGTYQADIWTLRTTDSGIYQVVINNQQVVNGLDLYANQLNLAPTPVTFVVNPLLDPTGQAVVFRFTCVAKNPNSADYRMFLDKIVVR